jgi:glycosyltransferase involved in cell wall biosynthesis
MKVLYIGHYKERGGWAEATKNYILAMNEVGIDVVCRNVTLTQDHPVSKEIEKLEKKSTENVDICIQHVLPHHLIGTNQFKKNIAFLASESTSIKDLTWFEYLKLMDEIWVPNTNLKLSLENDGLKNITIIPHCFDVEKYTKKYPEINLPISKDAFKFYYIGDWNERKNIEAIIRCFHSEFDEADDVQLIFKINKFGYTQEKLQSEFNNFVSQYKQKLRIHQDQSRYKKEIIIANHLSDDQLCAFHQYCDCFLCPSHGEAWSIPSFEAMAFGNIPICTNFGGPSDFIDQNNVNTGYLIDGIEISCLCSDAAFPEIFTSREYWIQPSDMQIRKAMRHAYENKDKLKCKKDGIKRAKLFSYEKIGQLIKDKLNEYTNS